MSPGDVLLRLAASCAAGAVLGVDRQLHHKPAGLRTLTLVSLASSLFTLSALGYADRAAGVDPLRVVQGVITGIGFLGGGVILRRERDSSVHGLTTASAIWVAAALGIACGLGLWITAVAGAALAVIVLGALRAVESGLGANGPGDGPEGQP